MGRLVDIDLVIDEVARRKYEWQSILDKNKGRVENPEAIKELVYEDENILDFLKKLKMQNMERLVDIDTLRKEIEKKDYEIFPDNDGKMRIVTTPTELEQGWLNALQWMRKLLDTLPEPQESKDDIDLVKAEVERLKSIAENRMENIPPLEHPETVDEEYLKHMTRSREAKMDGLGGQVEAYTNVLFFLDTLNEPIVMHTPRYAPPEPQELNVDLEKGMDKFYGIYRDDNGNTFDKEDNEPCFDWKNAELSEHEMELARYFYELGRNSKL